MQEVKLKVECQFVGHQKGWGSNKLVGSVKLNPVGPQTGGASEENAAFFAATPSGLLEFATVNEQAMAMFHPGGTYIVTIAPAPDSPIAEFAE